MFCKFLSFLGYTEKPEEKDFIASIAHRKAWSRLQVRQVPLLPLPSLHSLFLLGSAPRLLPWPNVETTGVFIPAPSPWAPEQLMLKKLNLKHQRNVQLFCLQLSTYRNPYACEHIKVQGSFWLLLAASLPAGSSIRER